MSSHMYKHTQSREYFSKIKIVNYILNIELQLQWDNLKLELFVHSKSCTSFLIENLNLRPSSIWVFKYVACGPRGQQVWGSMKLWFYALYVDMHMAKWPWDSVVLESCGPGILWSWNPVVLESCGPGILWSWNPVVLESLGLRILWS
jgi:hypothetical protein